MKVHHIGVAVKNIEKEIENYRNIFEVEAVGGIVYDPIQCARLCMLTISGGMRFELVEGKPVEKYVKKGMRMYHVCYEVADIEQEMARLEQKHSVVVSQPSPCSLVR